MQITFAQLPNYGDEAEAIEIINDYKACLDRTVARYENRYDPIVGYLWRRRAVFVMAVESGWYRPSSFQANEFCMPAFLDSILEECGLDRYGEERLVHGIKYTAYMRR